LPNTDRLSKLIYFADTNFDKFATKSPSKIPPQPHRQKCASDETLKVAEYQATYENSVVYFLDSGLQFDNVTNNTIWVVYPMSVRLTT